MTLLALLFACRSYDGPTFHADVAPVLDAYCMRCHTEGGIAPMKFDTYDEVKQWGPAIAEATANRTMPPKQVVADGSCGDWRDPWWMGDDEIALLSEWVVNEMPEGDAAPRGEPAALPTLDATHTVQTPVFEPVPVGGQYSEYDEYRCFAMPIEALAEDRFLAGYDVKPGTPTIVHHVIGHIVDPAADSWYSGRTNAEQMAYLDALDPDRAGWPCFSGAGDDVAYESDPMAWAPGQGATEFPNGLGVRVPAGSMIVTQVHYNLVDPATAGSTDTTQLEMKLVPEDEITKQMFVVYLDFLLGYGDSLPAGRDTVRYRDRISLSQLGLPLTVDLVGLLPHMHARGLRLNATLKREDGSEECVVEVPAWDYGWQFAYFYETPIRIDPDDLYELTCWFDTSDATEPIYGGWGTQNEMCLTVMYVTI
ncbi:MAG: hypothetical protein H6737_21665 [Alphaproteobacteria bacterium]|nr:hypothetical protein [Alphaproteobacteria bacterium]